LVRERCLDSEWQLNHQETMPLAFEEAQRLEEAALNDPTIGTSSLLRVNPFQLKFNLRHVHFSNSTLPLSSYQLSEAL
jgi:hypothetical protein